MTTEVVTLSSICAGGDHLTFTLSGARVATVTMTMTEAQEPLSEDEAIAFCRVIAKMARAGRTLNQTRTLLQNGVTVNV